MWPQLRMNTAGIHDIVASLQAQLPVTRPRWAEDLGVLEQRADACVRAAVHSDTQADRMAAYRAVCDLHGFALKELARTGDDSVLDRVEAKVSVHLQSLRVAGSV